MHIVHLGEWEFIIDTASSGVTYVSVPDCGGMADSVPRIPEQLEWAEATFAELAVLKQVWATSWEIAPGGMSQLEDLLRRHGAQL